MSEPSHLLPVGEAPSSKFRLGTTALAIGAGLVVDIGGTISSQMFALAKLGLVMALAHLPFSLAELSNTNHHPGQLMAGYFDGMSYTFAGAYVAAVIGRNQPVLNAALFGLATMLSGLCLAGSAPLWFNILYISTTVPLTALVGYVVRRTYR